MIKAKNADTDFGLREKMRLIGLIEDGMGRADGAGYARQLFGEISGLIEKTRKGARIESLRERGRKGYKKFFVTSEGGERLARLHAVFLESRVPVYYLVFVETSPRFEKMNLASELLMNFRKYLDRRKAIGILNNIIDPKSKAHGMYEKNGWAPLAKLCPALAALNGNGNFMLYVPKAMKADNALISEIVRTCAAKEEEIHLSKNIEMVKETILGFRKLQEALAKYAATALGDAAKLPVLRYLFTLFAMSFNRFRREIRPLIGYTGGESALVINLPPEIARLRMKSYPPAGATEEEFSRIGGGHLKSLFPPEFWLEPARTIERKLPIYPRPKFAVWLDEKGRKPEDELTIGDLIDLKFDPTRLKKIKLGREAYIFERARDSQLSGIEEKKEVFRKIAGKEILNDIPEVHVSIMPVDLVIRERSTVYILRKQVDGIHADEALEMLASPRLKDFNDRFGLDKEIAALVADVKDRLAEAVGEELADKFTVFVPWYMDYNYPRLCASDPVFSPREESVLSKKLRKSTVKFVTQIWLA